MCWDASVKILWILDVVKALNKYWEFVLLQARHSNDLNQSNQTLGIIQNLSAGWGLNAQTLW